MKWEDVKVGQYVLHKDNYLHYIWLACVNEYDKETNVVVIEDVWSGHSDVVGVLTTNINELEESYGLLKVFNEIPKEFLI